MNTNAELTEEKHAASVTRGLWKLSSLTLLSRILGMIRDITMAACFGSGVLMDAFTIGFRIPNLFRRVFGEGALTAAFLPEFLQQKHSSEPENAWKLAAAVFFLLTGLLSLLVVLISFAIGACLLTQKWSNETLLLLQLTLIMFPYVLLVCQMALFVAILQAEQRFAISALLPIVLNVIWIATLWLLPLLSGTLETQLYLVALSVVCAGLVQVLLPILYLYSSGVRFPADWKQKWPDAQRLFWGMVPVVTGMILTQFNTVFDSLLAWWYSMPGRHLLVEHGTAASLYFAQRLFQFPLGVFGVALASVLFPLLSRAALRDDRTELLKLLHKGMVLCAGLGLPASVGLMMLAKPVTSLLFERGQFDQQDVEMTARFVQAYGASVWVMITLGVVHRVYYALGNSATPMWWAIIAAVVNIVLDIVLINQFGGVGLAWASVASALVQLLGLWSVLPIFQLLNAASLLKSIRGIVIASAGLGATIMLIPVLNLPPGFELPEKSGNVVIPVVCGSVVYLLLIRACRIDEIAELLPSITPWTRQS